METSNTPYFQGMFADIRHTRELSGSTSFNTNPNNKHRSLSPNNRRKSTTAFESRSFSRDTSPQPSNRRFSNPINQTTYASTNSASCSRSRSPSDPQYQGGVNTQMRRFSQPANSAFGNNYNYGPNFGEGDTERRSLASQEKESYSSLRCLPEVRAYLKFMEDDIPLPQRSKSFNGRNSSRRSSFNRRRRSKSRTRTPTPTPFDYDDNECFDRNPASNMFQSMESTKTYGRFLTPQRSLEPNSSANRSNSVDFTEMYSSSSASAGRLNNREETYPQPLVYNNEMNGRRRSGSIIRTTFI